jgi:hypothetical protein
MHLKPKRRLLMRKLLLVLAAMALSMPMMASADSPFDGTWKIDLNKASFSPKPDVIVLANGVYECSSCVPAIKIKADGADHAVTGHPYFDTVAITVVNDHEIQETDKKSGVVVTTSTSTVSPDGNSIEFSFTDSGNTNGGPPVTGKGRSTRVANGPSGSHAVSGSWKMDKIDDISENAIVWTYKINRGKLTMTSPTGQSFTAPLDGTMAAMQGDPGVTNVSVTMVGKNTLVESDIREGKVISVWKMTLQGDGKTAKGIGEDKLQKRTTEFVVVKQ